MTSADILIVGGGIAGLSLASGLGSDRRIVLIEAEEAPGFHSTGRSATMVHYALGDPLVRALTKASRPFFDDPGEGFSEVPLGKRAGVLVHARDEELPALDSLAAGIDPFAAIDRVGPDDIRRLCPVLRTEPGEAAAGLFDANGIRLDPDALLQGHVRKLRRQGGKVITGARATRIERRDSVWRVETRSAGGFEAPILVNAAGAWADQLATMAGASRLGLRPLRRTIIVFDPTEGFDPAGLPFTKTVGDELYFGPESGRIFASPMDEGPSVPCDAQPEEYEVALAAARIEQRTTMTVSRIAHRWAGLRTFAPDRHPVVGFDPRSDGFFWLAGQGGCGLQTSPAIAAIAAALIRGDELADPVVDSSALGPGRLLGNTA